MFAPAQTSAPPLPPQISAQQQEPPLRQFAQSAGGPGSGITGAQGVIAKVPSMALVKQLLNDIGTKLESIAKILVTEQPDKVPLLKPVVQGLAMLMNQVDASQTQGQPVDVQSTGSPGDSAPQQQQDVSGGAAMGASGQ